MLYFVPWLFLCLCNYICKLCLISCSYLLSTQLDKPFFFFLTLLMLIICLKYVSNVFFPSCHLIC